MSSTYLVDPIIIIILAYMSSTYLVDSIICNNNDYREFFDLLGNFQKISIFNTASFLKKINSNTSGNVHLVQNCWNGNAYIYMPVRSGVYGTNPRTVYPRYKFTI